MPPPVPREKPPSPRRSSMFSLCRPPRHNMRTFPPVEGVFVTPMRMIMAPSSADYQPPLCGRDFTSLADARRRVASPPSGGTGGIAAALPHRPDVGIRIPTSFPLYDYLDGGGAG